MKKQYIPPEPVSWPRADPEALARFDPATKQCTMNCGPHCDDPRSAAERKFLCDDCTNTHEAAPVERASPGEILRKKLELAHTLTQYQTECGDMDCGHAMAQYLNPRARQYAERVNLVAEWLRGHDPEFPKSWSPL